MRKVNCVDDARIVVDNCFDSVFISLVFIAT